MNNKNSNFALAQHPMFQRSAMALAVAAVSLSAQAGKITTDPVGFGGWNLENVEIVINEEGYVFEECCGTYTPPDVESFSYYADVTDGTVVVAKVLAKDWPVGEPPGIKVVHNDQGVKPPKPQNCIMATSYLEEHFLDTADPQQVTCSGPFQSHKRYKLAMLPSTVADGSGSEQGVDLVFNVELEEGSRDYQVFQKINNWTNTRLEGFTIEVGTGVGEEFASASSNSNVGVANLSLSVPADVWPDGTKLANFSTGLFGPEDKRHERPSGYFDPDTRAGFKIKEYPVISGVTDTLTSDGTLGSDYADLPKGGLAQGQFGPWLPNSMLPQGIFFDDDGNPATDAQLMAWYGYNPAFPESGLGWMTGVAEGFSPKSDETIEEWGSNLTYTMGPIDDLVNVGLNYIVSIGDISGFPDFVPDSGTATFTIRITPLKDTSGVGAPSYTGVTPEPILIFTSSDGVVELSPSPTFEVGSLLTVRVGDADLNDDPSLAETITVGVQIDDNPPVALELIEQGENRGVFAASLSADYSNLNPGQKVTVAYVDEDTGSAVDVPKAASTTAVSVSEPPPPAPAEVDITELSVPESLYDGQTRNLSVVIKNSDESESTASGTLTLEGSNGSVFSEDFTDLRVKGKKKFNFRWQARLANPAEPEEVVWTATLDLDDGVDKYLSGSTMIDVKVKGKDRVE